MKMKTLLMAFVAVVVMSSCSTSSSALADLRDLSNQINIEGSTYGVREWKTAADKYYKVDREILKHAEKGEYTDAQMEEIGELQGACVSGFAKGLGQNIVTKAQNAASLIKGIVKGFKEGFGVE